MKDRYLKGNKHNLVNSRGWECKKKEAKGLSTWQVGDIIYGEFNGLKQIPTKFGYKTIAMIDKQELFINPTLAKQLQGTKQGKMITIICKEIKQTSKGHNYRIFSVSHEKQPT